MSMGTAHTSTGVLPKRRTRGRPKDAISRDARRGSILAAAGRVVRRDGLAVTMDSVATEAGVTKPVIYSHFGDKAGLCAAVAVEMADEIAERVGRAVADDGEAREILVRAVDAFLAFIEDEPAGVQFLLEHRTGSDAAILAVGRGAAEILEARLAAAGQDTTPAQLWGHGIVGFVVLSGAWWGATGAATRAEVGDALTTFLWEGLSGIGLD